MQFFSDLFREAGLTPQSYCLLWQPGLIWLHVASDTIIGLSYYAIPIALAYFIWKRPEIDFGWLFWMFAGLFSLARIAARRRVVAAATASRDPPL